MKVDKVIEIVTRELARAQESYPPFNTNHEGVAVIREEFEELWDLVKATHPSKYNIHFNKEAVQLAAMAIRFLIDRCPV